jgi:pimeloyl-ACP methyl ester carboxylesterase
MLTAPARRIVRALADTCLAPDSARLGRDVTAQASGLRYTRERPWDRAPWRGPLDRNSPGRTSIAAPVLVVHGLADRLVPPAATQSFSRRLCATGTLVQVRAVRATHADAARRSAGAVARWIADRFAGRAARTSC